MAKKKKYEINWNIAGLNRTFNYNLEYKKNKKQFFYDNQLFLIWLVYKKN